LRRIRAGTISTISSEQISSERGMNEQANTGPSGDLCIRTLAMPADTNANGDIFGGWLLSQMDVGGGVFASKAAKSRTVTVAIEAMNFRKAVYVGDLVSVYANLVRVGRTSMTVHLEAWALRRRELQPILVTDGNFTYVSIDDDGRPQTIQRNDPPIAT
jgi:acyl-CoA thioesterase YciA